MQNITYITSHPEERKGAFYKRFKMCLLEEMHVLICMKTTFSGARVYSDGM